MVKKEKPTKERKRYLTYVMKFKDDISLDVATDSMSKLIKDIWGESLENATFQNKFFSDEKVGVISIIYTGKIELIKKIHLKKYFPEGTKSKTFRRKFVKIMTDL